MTTGRPYDQASNYLQFVPRGSNPYRSVPYCDDYEKVVWFRVGSFL